MRTKPGRGCQKTADLQINHLKMNDLQMKQMQTNLKMNDLQMNQMQTNLFPDRLLPSAPRIPWIHRR